MYAGVSPTIGVEEFYNDFLLEELRARAYCEGFYICVDKEDVQPRRARIKSSLENDKLLVKNINNQLMISLKSNIRGINLIDMSGKILYEEKFDGDINRYTLDLTSLSIARGVYILKVNDLSEKIIIE